MKHDFYHRRAAVHLKRPRLPRITRCPCGGSRAPEHSRAERGTTPSVGNAHPNPQPYPIQKRSGWAETLIHSHPKAHPSPSKAHPKRVWLGSLQAVTIIPSHLSEPPQSSRAADCPIHPHPSPSKLVSHPNAFWMGVFDPSGSPPISHPNSLWMGFLDRGPVKSHRNFVQHSRFFPVLVT